MPDKKPVDYRLAALWRFATAISVFNLLGHTLFGFEQPWATPFVALAASYGTEILLEWADAWAHGRRPRFLGSARTFVEFLLPAHITGLAVGMLLYSNASLMPAAFAACAGIASKNVFRVAIGGRTRHFFNPSNFGITATLLLIPSVGLAPPYQFTENVTGMANWIIPAVILVSGIFMHAKFTGRLPLVAAWLVGFAMQGLIRAEIFGIPWRVPFVPMTSAAFILFTLYMIPDPATTPIAPRRQVLFGLAIAAVYGLLFVFHVVFGLFIALAVVSASRGIGLHLNAIMKMRKAESAASARTAFTAAGLAR